VTRSRSRSRVRWTRAVRYHRLARLVPRMVACEGYLKARMRGPHSGMLLLIESRRVRVGGRKMASRILGKMLGILHRSRALIPGRRCRRVHGREMIVLREGPVQFLQRKQILRRRVMRMLELSLGEWLWVVVGS